MRVLEAGPARGADVLEEHAVDQPVVLLEVDEPIAVSPEDLADIVLAQGGHALVMVGALDDDLVGADAGHHVVDAVAALVEAALDLQGGEPVGDDADPPARPVGPRAEMAVGEDLRRASCLPAPRRTGRPPRLDRPALPRGSRAGRLARSCAMITQRPTIGSFLSSGMCSLLDGGTGSEPGHHARGAGCTATPAT